MTMRVCLVEDDADIRDTLRFIFEETEAIIEEAADGEAALALLREQPAPRVMLLDRVMPRLDGVGVLRALAQTPDLRQRTTVLLMTACQEPPTAALAELLASLRAEVISKPFDVDDLLAQVDRAWQRMCGTDARP
jgi:CheY-like chemotaxis protein